MCYALKGRRSVLHVLPERRRRVAFQQLGPEILFRHESNAKFFGKKKIENLFRYFHLQTVEMKKRRQEGRGTVFWGIGGLVVSTTDSINVAHRGHTLTKGNLPFIRDEREREKLFSLLVAQRLAEAISCHFSLSFSLCYMRFYVYIRSMSPIVE